MPPKKKAGSEERDEAERSEVEDGEIKDVPATIADLSTAVVAQEQNNHRLRIRGVKLINYF